jgi:alpha-ketoglutarate-dependent taurine dioxygenase
MFLKDLIEHTTQQKFVYSHAWSQHDLVMWSNRCTMHRVRRFDEAQVRNMRRTKIAGDQLNRLSDIYFVLNFETPGHFFENGVIIYYT